MPRTIKKHPFLTLVVLGLLAAGGMYLGTNLLSTKVQADTIGPASILPETATIQAPVSGGTVFVTGQVGGSAYAMAVWGRSVTRDNLLNNGVAQWYSFTYVPNAPGWAGMYYGNVQAAAYGDLLEIKATNFYYGQYHTDIEQIGYVPAGSDTAPPEFTTNYISSSYSGATFSVTITTYYGLYDPSYPLTVTLLENDNPTNKYTTIITSTSDYPKTLYLAVGSNERVRLYAQDNYGNGRSLFYITTQLGFAAATNSFTAEPNQADAERTGNQSVGGIGVQLHNGSYVHAEELLSVRGKVLGMAIPGVYRSRGTYDGSWGKSWDSLLNSRIQFIGNDVKWRPGNGREETFLFQGGGTPFWKSPIGLFLRFTGASGTYYIAFPNGVKYTYQNNYLQKIQDLNGNNVQFVRDSAGNVFRIVDDLGRIYNIYYFDHKRVAEVEDYTGDSILFEYNSNGNLAKITDQAGLTRRFDYQVSSPYMMTKAYDRNDRASLENVYATSGSWINQVTTQKQPAGATAAYGFNYTAQSVGLVVVTDPNGTARKYYYDAANGYLKTSMRTCANTTLRDQVANYYWTVIPNEPLDSVPNWVETKYDYNLENYLCKRQWIQWCPGSSGGDCPTGVGVLKTPYTWFDYNSGIQDSASVDPRVFGTLRLIRQDKEQNPNDDDRNGESLRESWTYEVTTDYVKASTHWEERAWRYAGIGVETQDPSTWDATLGALENPPVAASPFKTSYTYSSTGNLVKVTHPNSSQPVIQNTIEDVYTYNSSGQISTQTEPYDASDPINDPAVTTQYTYYVSGLQKGMLQTSWIDIPGTSADPKDTYEYDALGRIVAHTDGRGYKETMSYDGLDRILTNTQPYVSSGQHTTTYVYSGQDLVETRFPNKDHTGVTPTGEPTEIKTTYQYDSVSGVKTKEIKYIKKEPSNPQQPLTSETIYEYDVLFNVIRTKVQFSLDGYKVSDALYDEFNRAVRTIDYLTSYTETPPNIANDAVTDTYFNERGNAFRAVDPNGLVTSYVYDSYGRSIRTDKPNGISDVTEYNDTSEVNPTQNKPLRKQYSVVMTTDNPPNEIRISQRDSFSDEVGRSYLQRIYYELGQNPQYYEEESRYYKSGRKQREHDQFAKRGTPYFHFWAYDAAGRVKTHKSPGLPGQERSVESFVYDANNNVTSKTESEYSERTLSINNVSITYTYDALNRTITVVQSGQTRRSYYDSHNRLKRQTFSALGLETQTFYDLAGNVEETLEKVTASPVTWLTRSYTTDYFGRMLTHTKPNPKNDPLNPEVTTTYVRDDFGQGRILSVLLPAVNQISDTYTYSYDLGGRVILEEDPNHTQKNYFYDVVNGYLDHIDVSRGPGLTSFGGPEGTRAVEFVYTGLGGGCTCSGGPQATEIVTKINGVVQTKVARTFNALGRLKAETVCFAPVSGGVCMGSQYNVSYEYDYNYTAVGKPQFYRETLVYPGGKRRAQIHDVHGTIAELWSTVFTQTEEQVATYLYQGKSKIAQRDYFSNSAAHSVVNTASYDSGGFGNQTENRWYKNGATVANWDATYDAANRVQTKKLGTTNSVNQFTFEYNLRGYLTKSTYYAPDITNPPPPAEPAPGQPRPYQFMDSSGETITRDSLGNVQQLTESFTPGGGQQTDEPMGYTPIHDERGRVTQLSGEHIFAYWADVEPGEGLVNWRSKTGPQTKLYDGDGNLIQLNVTYFQTDNPTTPQEGIPDGPQWHEQKTYLYQWTYKYDAWDRLVEAVKNATLTDSTVTNYHYTITNEWVYDGLGRRVRVKKTSDDDQFKAPLPLQGDTYFDFLEVNDQAGRVVRSIGNVDNTYIHGPGQMPAMASFLDQAQQQSPPQYYLTDVDDNAGALLDGADGNLEDEKSTMECGEEKPRQSGGTGGFDFNWFGNAYGSSEPGMEPVDEKNAGRTIVVSAKKKTYEPETEKHEDEEEDFPEFVNYDNSASKAKLKFRYAQPLTGGLFGEGANDDIRKAYDAIVKKAAEDKTIEVDDKEAKTNDDLKKHGAERAALFVYYGHSLWSKSEKRLTIGFKDPYLSAADLAKFDSHVAVLCGCSGWNIFAKGKKKHSGKQGIVCGPVRDPAPKSKGEAAINIVVGSTACYDFLTALKDEKTFREASVPANADMKRQPVKAEDGATPATYGWKCTYSEGYNENMKLSEIYQKALGN